MNIKIVIASLFVVLLALTFTSQVHALQQGEITLQFNWSQSVYYQGDSGTVTISLSSTCGDELEFTWVGIHFAWMDQNTYYSLDVSSRIASGGSTQFGAISFSIPSNAAVGWDSYQVKINYNEHHWYGWYGGSWTSSSFQISIHDAYEKVYNQLNPEVSNKIGNAQNANYQSADAQSLLQQANTEYNLGTSLAQQGKWQDAVTHLQSASNFVDQALAKEQTYQTQLAQEHDQYNQEYQQVSSKINDGQNANYKSSNAQSLFQQANQELSTANSLANQGRWQEAITHLQTASNYA